MITASQNASRAWDMRVYATVGGLLGDLPLATFWDTAFIRASFCFLHRATDFMIPLHQCTVGFVDRSNGGAHLLSLFLNCLLRCPPYVD